MQSKKLPRFAELKKSLKKLLRRYNSIKDIIIFGSFVKGRDSPKDIDLAVIVAEKDLNMVTAIKEEVGIEDIHITLMEFEDIYSGGLFLSLLKEGYSLKEDDFLKNRLGIRPVRFYIYDLKHLDKSKKTMFGIALRKNLQKTKGEKIGAGAVLIPIEQASYFEDFLDVWGMKYKTKELTVF